jgi:hypothetical protein
MSVTQDCMAQRRQALILSLQIARGRFVSRKRSPRQEDSLDEIADTSVAHNFGDEEAGVSAGKQHLSSSRRILLVEM